MRHLGRLVVALTALWALTLTAPGAQRRTLVLSGGRAYLTPDTVVQPAVVVIEDQRIVAAGVRGNVAVPAGAEIYDCTGMTILPGFWNSHVHFTEPKWENADALGADRLTTQLGEMFLQYGFTTVFDTGSFLANTLAIRRRIEAGEVDGPLVFSTGPGLVPEHGSPYYIRPVTLPEAVSPDAGVAMVKERIGEGADAVKIFSASWGEPGRAVPMSSPIVHAIVKTAHALGKPVFAHPSTIEGLEGALAGGVDILTHSVEVPGILKTEDLLRMKAGGMALIPTLTLFAGNRSFADIAAQVNGYVAMDGAVLFGTDVGFLPQYSPLSEYRLLAKAGLDLREILASLTITPASRHGMALRKGVIRSGMDADLVVVWGDPALDIDALADVRRTIRNGRMVFRRDTLAVKPAP